jgi:hypothetical protein
VLGVHQLALAGWQVSERLIGGVYGANTHQALNPDGILADVCFEEAASAVSLTSDEHDAFFTVFLR